MSVYPIVGLTGSCVEGLALKSGAAISRLKDCRFARPRCPVAHDLARDGLGALLFTGWTAIDADTNLCVTYYVGDRGHYSAYNFMWDAAKR
jgi:hypothetical protein